MAKRKVPSRKSSAKARDNVGGIDIDTTKFENVYQIGGIQTATLDHPQPNGSPGCRVAHVNTGSGLRFTVALDRGGDIVEASYNQYNLAYLTPNQYKPPNPAYHHDQDWLSGWPGGLLTSCGPEYFGPPREEDGAAISLHGRHSNTPATLEMVLNPDPHRGRYEMLLSMVIRDTRLFGPHLEVRRQIQCILGQPQIQIYDQVTNRADTTVAHHWLYHVNPGYPLLNRGARLIYRGQCTTLLPTPRTPPTAATLNRLKRVPDAVEEHRGAGETLVLIDPKPDRSGICHVGLVNPKIKLGFELAYPLECLPRLGNWQHFSPDGSYVTGLEPFRGSLLGKANDPHPLADQKLKPGQTRRYQMTIKLHTTAADLRQLSAYDGPVKP